MIGYPGAVQMPVDRSRVFIDALKDPFSHYAIVIHKTAAGGPTTARDQARYFATNAEMKSVHYVVDKDGEIVQCVDEIDGAGGNCCTENGYDSFWDHAPVRSNLNLCTFSIEHCDYSNDNSDPMPDAQKQASYKLVSYLMQKYGITMDRVKGHNSIAPISRAHCPGNYDWNGLRNYIGGSMPVPKGWTDNSVTKELSAPGTRAVVRFGFRDHILADPTWDSENIPTKNEEYQPVNVLESDISYGPGSTQIFRDTALGYTKKAGVFVLPLGQEFNYVRQDRDNCKTIIAELQTQIESLKQGVPQQDVSAVQNSLAQLLKDLAALAGK